MTATRLRRCASLVSLAFFGVLPLLALAAEQTVRKLEDDLLTSRFWIAWLVAQAIIVVGYCASSLPKWAKWVDRVLHERLEILSGVAASVLAGNIAFYGGIYYLQGTLVVGFMAAGAAAWAGDKFLTPVLSRVMSVTQPRP